MNEIEKLRECLMELLLPIQIYLLVLMKIVTYTNERDLDSYFVYIVVRDDTSKLLAETAKGYKAIKGIKQRP